MITLFALSKLWYLEGKKNPLNKKLKLVLSYNLSWIDTSEQFRPGLFYLPISASYKYFEIILNYSFYEVSGTTKNINQSINQSINDQHNFCTSFTSCGV